MRRFERERLKNESMSFFDKLRIFEAMWSEARSLGIEKKSGPLQGIEKTIRIAKIANGL